MGRVREALTAYADAHYAGFRNRTARTVGRLRLRAHHARERTLSFLAPPLPDQPSDHSQGPRKDPYDQGHPERGLDVQRLANIFDEAESGSPASQVAVLHGLLERDPTVRDLFSHRRWAVTGKPWTITPGGKDKADIYAADAMRDALSGANVVELLEHLLTDTLHGWAAAETAWIYEGSLIRPAEFDIVPHTAFRVSVPGDLSDIPPGRLMLVTDSSPMGEALLHGQWVTTRFDATLPLVRCGLGRTAAWWMLFKIMAVRDFVLYVHRHGVPTILARVEQWTDETSKRIARNLINQFGIDGGAIVDSSVEVEFPEPSAGNSRQLVHSALIALGNAECSKLVYGATLANDNSSQGAASYALSNTHSNVRWENILRDAMRVQAAFSRHVCEPFMRFNNLSGRTPGLRIQVVQVLAPHEVAKVAAVMRNDLGLECDEMQLRGMIGLRAPGEGTK